MSSKVNEALFDLIQSMSKSEKRYFKLMSSRHTIGDENNYVRLFDFVDKQEQYDEATLCEHFKGEPFLNRFSITKKRLYDHILASLDSFHVSNSIEAQLYKLLHSADILFEKSLYDQSRRILRSAEKLAEKNEMHEVLLLISKKQMRLMETNGYLDLSDQALSSFIKHQENTVGLIQQLSEIWNIKSRLFLQLSKKGVARCEDDQKSYTNICQSLLDVGELKEPSTESHFLLHHTLSAYYYAIGDFDHSLIHLHKNLEMFDDTSIPLNIEPNKQLSVLTNAIYVADKIGHHRESLMYLAKLKKMANEIDSNEDLSIKLFSSISSIEFSMCIRKGNFDDARRLAKTVEVQLEKYGSKIVPVRRAFLEFKMAVVFMGIGDYSEALKWVNNILNDSNLDKTEDIIGFTQLLDLLIHIELNHDKLLPYSLKSTQRFFKTRNRLYSFEKVFLQFIGKLIKCDDRFEIENLWEDLYNDLSTVTDDTFESIALEYFDFKSWAEAKLKRKSFDAVVREKYYQIEKIAS
ncbi:MAG: hypothetical protein QNK23_14585 [Crocinitomicaceae bacterium]|nr:hypothetical protein [Crocinitomicaceae bacterium]